MVMIDMKIPAATNCHRCDIATTTEPVLHSYEWHHDELNLTLWWNITEVRLLLGNKAEKHIEHFPYQEGFIELVQAHEISPEHIAHIPADKIRPSLIGDLWLPNKDTGECERYTVMLDGHHSAMSRIMQNQTVELDRIPDALMLVTAAMSQEDLMNRDLIVLESKGLLRSIVA